MRSGTVRLSPPHRPAHRRIGAGPQPPVRVGVWRKDRHALAHGRQQTRHRVPHDVRDRPPDRFVHRAGQHVVAVLVEQAAVNVQAASCLVRKRLGHEAGDHAVLARHRLDAALQQDCLVACLQRIVGVVQVDLVLPGRILLHEGFRRQSLFLADLLDLVEQRLEIIKFFNAIDVHRPRPPAGFAAPRRHDVAVRRRLLVDEVELVLDGHHRRQADVLEPVHDAR